MFNPSFPISAQDCFALVFCDGLSASEGFLMRAWYESQRFPCLAVGGSAGGKLDFSATYMHDGQRVLSGRAMLVFCKVRKGIRFSPFKTQNFVPAGKSWLVAEADPVARTVSSVFTADGRTQGFLRRWPAHFRCAEGEVEKHLAGHTFAVSVNDEMFIRLGRRARCRQDQFFLRHRVRRLPASAQSDRFHRHHAARLAAVPGLARGRRWRCCSTTACCVDWATRNCSGGPISSPRRRPPASRPLAKSSAFRSTRRCRRWSSSAKARATPIPS